MSSISFLNKVLIYHLVKVSQFYQFDIFNVQKHIFSHADFPAAGTLKQRFTSSLFKSCLWKAQSALIGQLIPH